MGPLAPLWSQKQLESKTARTEKPPLSGPIDGVINIGMIITLSFDIDVDIDVDVDVYTYIER